MLHTRRNPAAWADPCIFHLNSRPFPLSAMDLPSTLSHNMPPHCNCPDPTTALSHNLCPGSILSSHSTPSRSRPKKSGHSLDPPPILHLSRSRPRSRTWLNSCSHSILCLDFDYASRFRTVSVSSLFPHHLDPVPVPLQPPSGPALLSN
jgi:hypothetical protein